MFKNKLLVNLVLLLTLAIGVWQIVIANSINTNNRFVYIFILASIVMFFLALINIRKNKLLKNLCLLIITMSGFSFTLVPLYNVFCEVTGLNGKVDLTVAAATSNGVDLEREVTVEFVVNHNRSMPWIFKPKDSSITVHPGELASTAYYAKNPTAVTMRAQAIPSISPSKVSKYFKKVECFCFTNQQLGPGESAHLGLQFYLDRNFPPDVKRVTLAYTIFDVSNQ